jgi:hypothetical protein
MTDHIHIPAVAPVVHHVAGVEQTLFDFSFPVFRPEDLLVFVGDQLQASGYEVKGDGASDGGVVRFATAPAAGSRVTLLRHPAYQRLTDIDTRPDAHAYNDLADAFTAAMQEVDEALSRSVARKVTSASAADLSLPEPEAGKLLGWNGSASGLVNVTAVDTNDVLLKSNNLADLPDKAAARTNLGLGSAATHADSDFATSAQGAKADSAVQPGDLGTAAALDVGTSAGNVVQLDGSGRLPAVDGSQLTNLPNTGSSLFASPETEWVTDCNLTIAHTLGTTPVATQVILVCKTAENGYFPGDRVWPTGQNHTTAVVTNVNATSVRVSIGSYGLYIPSLSDHATGVYATPANWRMIVVAQA